MNAPVAPCFSLHGNEDAGHERKRVRRQEIRIKLHNRMLTELLLVWALNALALLAVANFVPGIHVSGYGSALIAAFFLGLANTLIRPLLLLLTLPATVITLGMFIFFINGLLFWAVGSVLRDFVVDDFWHGVLGAVLYSIFSWALSSAVAQLMRTTNK